MSQPPADAEELLDDLEDFEAIFKMMRDENTPSLPSSLGPHAKRQRCGSSDEGEAAVDASSAREARGLPRAASTEVVEAPKKDEELPPEQVILAFALLDLPLSASFAEVARQSRLLARSAHPDKVAPEFPEQRQAAVKKFQELQEARSTVTAWLQGRLDRMDDPFAWETSSEGSCAASDIVGDLEERDELRACGLPDKDADDQAAYPESPVAVAAGDDSPDELFAHEREEGDHVTIGIQSLATSSVPGGLVVAGSNPIEQAAVLARAMEHAAATGPKLCGECLERRAAKGADTCRYCKKELDGLWRTLQRRK